MRLPVPCPLHIPSCVFNVSARMKLGRLLPMNSPLAHSANARGLPHPLRDHSEAVARLAEEFARLFQSSGYGRCAGLWHDLGKNAPAFQECLARTADAHIEGARTGYGDHASAGAIHALAKFVEKAGAPLALVIAGHHDGLGDWAELASGRLKEQGLLARLRACEPNPAAVIPDPPPSTTYPFPVSSPLLSLLSIACATRHQHLRGQPPQAGRAVPRHRRGPPPGRLRP